MSEEEKKKPEPASEEKAEKELAETKDETEVAEKKEATAEGEASADEAKTEDARNVEDIAKRVAALDEEDEIERIAREEEAKLAERRRKERGGGRKKKGLEASASKRLAKIGEKAKPKRDIPDAVEAADPLIERTRAAAEWARKNKNLVQGLIVAAIAGAIAVGAWVYLDKKKSIEASVALAQAVADERGLIGDPEKEDEDAIRDKVPMFKTTDDRREAALAKYREVESKYKGTGASYLARLGEGALLLDKRDPDGALTAYNSVKGSALAAADTEVKGRALEGVGFAYEQKALLTPAEKDKDLDAALAAYKELESAADVKGFKELAMYHQARVLMNKGDKAKAKEVLLSLKERLSKTDDPIATGLPAPPTYPYLKDVAMDRLREIDPEAVPKPPKGGMGGAGGMSQEQIQKMMEKLKQQGGGK